MKSWLPCCLLSLVLIAQGCRSTPKSSTEITPVLASADVTETKPTSITFVDLPELQTGTGGMDSGPVPEFSSTDSGLNYRILRNSDRRKPTKNDTVTVNYRGWLNNGKVFDSSYDRGEPTSFPLSGVIAGWTEGMQLVGEGGMIELWVPSRLGYGERGSPGSIPAHANLHFIIELVDIE